MSNRWLQYLAAGGLRQCREPPILGGSRAALRGSLVKVDSDSAGESDGGGTRARVHWHAMDIDGARRRSHEPTAAGLAAGARTRMAGVYASLDRNAGPGRVTRAGRPGARRLDRVEGTGKDSGRAGPRSKDVPASAVGSEWDADPDHGPDSRERRSVTRRTASFAGLSVAAVYFRSRLRSLPLEGWSELRPSGPSRWSHAMDSDPMIAIRCPCVQCSTGKFNTDLDPSQPGRLRPGRDPSVTRA